MVDGHCINGTSIGGLGSPNVPCVIQSDLDLPSLHSVTARQIRGDMLCDKDSSNIWTTVQASQGISELPAHLHLPSSLALSAFLLLFLPLCLPSSFFVHRQLSPHPLTSLPRLLCLCVSAVLPPKACRGNPPVRSPMVPLPLPPCHLPPPVTAQCSVPHWLVLSITTYLLLG